MLASVRFRGAIWLQTIIWQWSGCLKSTKLLSVRDYRRGWCRGHEIHQMWRRVSHSASRIHTIGDRLWRRTSAFLGEGGRQMVDPCQSWHRSSAWSHPARRKSSPLINFFSMNWFSNVYLAIKFHLLFDRNSYLHAWLLSVRNLSVLFSCSIPLSQIFSVLISWFGQYTKCFFPAHHMIFHVAKKEILRLLVLFAALWVLKCVFHRLSTMTLTRFAHCEKEFHLDTWKSYSNGKYLHLLHLVDLSFIFFFSKIAYCQWAGPFRRKNLLW